MNQLASGERERRQVFESRINIFTGHFGSGKTEVAVNYVLQMHKLYGSRGDTVLVDLDVVNPFFRSADVKDAFEKTGIKVITPMYANTNSDAPALPAEISRVFEDKSIHAVFDVGGDDLGAKVLSRYKQDISADLYTHFFVVNPRRPFTDTPAKIEAMAREIEGSARLPVSCLVNNGNLLGETTPRIILEDQAVLERAARLMGLAVGFASGFADSILPVKDKLGCPSLVMEKHILLPWDR